MLLTAHHIETWKAAAKLQTQGQQSGKQGVDGSPTSVGSCWVIFIMFTSFRSQFVEGGVEDANFHAMKGYPEVSPK